jgi:hypothetical protein
MKVIAGLTLALALLLPAEADAQRHSNSYRYNSYSFSPYFGAFFDAYDMEADGSNLGWIAGFRAGYRESERVNFHLNLGYAKTGDVGSRPLDEALYPILDNEWVLLTAGGDFALVPGNTSVALGLDVGVGWRQVEAGGSSDVEPEPGWGTYELVAPGLTVRHQLTPRVGLYGTVQDYIFDLLEGPVQHTPVLAAGLTLR